MEKMFNIFRKFCKRSSVNPEEGSLFIEEIKLCSRVCLTERYKDSRLRVQMLHGLEKVSKIVNKLNLNCKLSEWECALLFWSCLSCCVHFSQEFEETDRLLEELNVKKSKGNLVNFLIYFISADSSEEKIMIWFLKFWTVCELWSDATLMNELLRDFLKSGIKYDVIIGCLSKHIVRSYLNKNEEIIKNIVSSLEMTFRNFKCQTYTYDCRRCLRLLLNVYHSLYASRFTSSTDNTFCHCILNCIGAFTSNIEDYQGICHCVETTASFIYEKSLIPTEVIELGTVVRITTSCYHKVTFSISLTETVSNCIINMINSTDKIICIIGYGIFKQILDRNKNKYIFKTVRLYKTNLMYHRYDLKKTESTEEEIMVDGKVFHSLNYALYRVITESLFRFKTEPEVMNKAYTCICLMVFEVPFHTVAINAIHIAMTFQDIILKEQTEPNADYGLCAFFHGIIIAIMSFVCYIHDEDCESLVTYVEGVINARKQKAIYLLPIGVPGRQELKLEGPLTMDNEVYLEMDEIHLAIHQSWSKYKFQPQYVYTDMRCPARGQTLKEIRKLGDDGVTTFDTLVVDEFDKYLKTVPLQFGISANTLWTPTHPKGPTFRPGQAFIMKTIYTTAEFYDRFHFKIELRTTFPSQSLVLPESDILKKFSDKQSIMSIDKKT